MKFISRLLETGIERQTGAEIHRIRLSNGIVLFSLFLVALYFLLFITVFPSNGAALYNVGVFIALLLCFPLTAKGYYITARVWYGIVLMSQFFSLTVFFMGKSAGIHLFFVAVAPMSFLLFDFSHKIQRLIIILFSLSSIVLFSFCQFFLDYGFSVPHNEVQFSSTIITLIFTLFGSSWIFTSEMNRATARLNMLATTDALSGLLNRRSFFSHGIRIMKEASLSRKPFALLLLDLDHFKKINDTYGHPVGDEIIRLFASRIKNILRTSDIFARLGGEEFGIILPETGEKGAKQVAEEIRSEVEKMKIDTGTAAVACTVSIGITWCQGHGNRKDFDTLLIMSDKALYASKKSGRNRYSVIV